MGLVLKTQTSRCQNLAKTSKSKYHSLTDKNTMHIQTRLDPDVLEAARQAAVREGISLSEYLRKLLEQNLESGNGKSGGSNGQAGGNGHGGGVNGETDRIR
jgi:predicted DNA binding CopG/RHH family protein